MADVAALAGVSHQTVSRVVNDSPSVREETRVRVRAAMVKLGYRPHAAARTLARGSSRLIGIITMNTTLFGPASVLMALQLAATDAGFGVTIAAVRGLDQASLTEAVGRHL